MKNFILTTRAGAHKETGQRVSPKIPLVIHYITTKRRDGVYPQSETGDTLWAMTLATSRSGCWS